LFLPQFLFLVNILQLHPSLHWQQGLVYPFVIAQRARLIRIASLRFQIVRLLVEGMLVIPVQFGQHPIQTGKHGETSFRVMTLTGISSGVMVQA